MCVIIYQPQHKEIEKDILKKCFEKNSDGVGWMYQQKGELITGKKLCANFAELLSVYEELPRNVPLGLHFRLASKGVIKEENCHPFVAPSQKLAVMHNGTFHCCGTVKGDKTDTEEFAEKYLFDFSNFIFKNPHFTELIASKATTNRLLIMSAEHSLIINAQNHFHGSGWTDDKKTWFSNDRWNVVETIQHYQHGYWQSKEEKKRKALTTSTSPTIVTGKQVFLSSVQPEP